MPKRGLGQLKGKPLEEREERFPGLHDEFFRQQVRFDWLPGEQAVMDTVEAKVEEQSEELFKRMEEALKVLFDSVRREDERGEEYLAWDTLDPREGESAVWAMNQEIARVKPKLTELFIHAEFSYNVWDDEYWEAYREANKQQMSSSDGTRQAQARMNTKDSRYHHAFRYYYWKSVKDRLDMYEGIKRDLEFALQRAVSRSKWA